jgi:hypothetical protein
LGKDKSGSSVKTVNKFQKSARAFQIATLMTDQEKNVSEIGEFIGELGAGVFEEKLARVLNETASAVMANDRDGEVVLRFKMKPISSSQTKVTHSIEFKAPTLNGVKSEKNTTDTVMYVGQKGKLSLFPEDQMQMFSKRGEVAR